jgi:hypothetical protein
MFLTQLPCEARIRILVQLKLDESEHGPHVSTGSNPFHNLLRGLCGIYDGDKSNDFHDRQGRILDTVLKYGQINQFVQRWR